MFPSLFSGEFENGVKGMVSLRRKKDACTISDILFEFSGKYIL